MDNFLQSLRMRQLFPVAPIPDYSAPPTPQPIAPIDNTGQTGQPFDVASRMRELYTPETQATDNYNNLVQNQPQYENPSFLRTVGAALSAFGPGGHQTGQEVMNWHNNKNATEWKNQLVPAEKAADNERQSNVNERTLAHTTVSNELRARADAEKEKNNAEVNKVRLMRANVYKFKAEQPNMELIFTPGGNIVARDKNNPNGKVITLTDDDGNPIPSGKLSDTDKANLSHKNTMERVNDQQAAAVDLEGVKQPNREALAETRGWQIGTIPDPNDPTKQIGVRINQITGETVPIQGGVFTKAGAPGKAAGTAVDPKIGLQKIRERTQETINAIDTLIDEKGNLTSIAQAATGKSRLFGLHKLPGTEAKTGDVTINNLKSRLVIDLIGEMKAQSRTGATGFGAMSVKELSILEAAIGKLDPEQDEAAFAAELNRIRDKLRLVMRPGEGEGNQTQTPRGNVPLTPADRDRVINQYLPKRK